MYWFHIFSLVCRVLQLWFCLAEQGAFVQEECRDGEKKTGYSLSFAFTGLVGFLIQESMSLVCRCGFLFAFLLRPYHSHEGHNCR